jgi:hypothetical protein
MNDRAKPVRIAPFEVVSFLFSLNPTYREHFLLNPADVRLTGRLDMSPFNRCASTQRLQNSAERKQ